MRLINRAVPDERYGRLLVLGQDESVSALRKESYWRCRCDCGKLHTAKSVALKAGKTQSCGCLRAEACVKSRLTHGHTTGGSTTGEYRVYTSMLTRCTNTNSRYYADYGGRGIGVCERWRHSFAAFLSDMGPRPAGLTLDRINNNGDYEPSNCRWATWIEQQRNRRNNRRILFRGEALSIAEWAERTGICGSTISRRLDRNWPVEHALTAPVGRVRHRASVLENWRTA